MPEFSRPYWPHIIPVPYLHRKRLDLAFENLQTRMNRERSTKRYLSSAAHRAVVDEYLSRVATHVARLRTISDAVRWDQLPLRTLTQRQEVYVYTFYIINMIAKSTIVANGYKWPIERHNVVWITLEYDHLIKQLDDKSIPDPQLLQTAIDASVRLWDECKNLFELASS